MKVRPVGAKLFHANRQTVKNEVKDLFSQLYEHAQQTFQIPVACLL
jgi:hypothetical protein